MAERGPIPKREAERRRRNKTDSSGAPNTVTRVDLQKFTGELVEPGPPGPWHIAALSIWDAALESGQRIFWEPSDWAVLRLLCSQISQLYRDDLIIDKVKRPIENGSGGGEELVYGSKPMSGAELATLLKGFASLGMTEGERRRMRLELERGDVGGEEPTPQGVVDARERFLGGP